MVFKRVCTQDLLGPPPMRTVRPQPPGGHRQALPPVLCMAGHLAGLPETLKRILNVDDEQG